MAALLSHRVREVRGVPTAADGRASTLAGTVRNVARAAGRDGVPYFVTVGSTGRYTVDRDESMMKVCGTYYRVHPDRVEVSARRLG